MFENEYLNFDNLFNDDIDNSDFDDIEEANEGVYKKPSKLTAITPENTEPWLSSEKTVQNFSKSYLFELCRRQKKLQKMLTKVDKKSQDYKDIMAEMNANKKIAKKILDARKKFGLPDIRNDSSFASIAGYGLLGNELINRYISKNQSSLEACDGYDDFDDDFEFEQDVLALEDAISMLVDEDEREDEFDRAVDEIEEINHPVDEILDEATESTGLFDTSTPAISNGLFEDLFKPATEAVEDDDEDGDLLEEDDGDDDFSDDELDGYVEPKQDYSDKEYDRDEALEEDF